MLVDDHDYLSWMASAALAVLMMVVMFWIRAQMPDDESAARPAEMATVNAQSPTATDASTLRTAQAKALRSLPNAADVCDSALQGTAGESLCAAGSVLRDMSVAGSTQQRDLAVVQQR